MEDRRSRQGGHEMVGFYEEKRVWQHTGMGFRSSRYTLDALTFMAFTVTLNLRSADRFLFTITEAKVVASETGLSPKLGRDEGLRDLGRGMPSISHTARGAYDTYEVMQMVLGCSRMPGVAVRGDDAAWCGGCGACSQPRTAREQ